MDNTPIIPSRNVAEPRTFVTKWQPELDKKVKRKKAFSKERDFKRGGNFEDNDDYGEQSGQIEDIYYESHYGTLSNEPLYNSMHYNFIINNDYDIYTYFNDGLYQLL